jgi:secreted PhoX family phosphatase
MPISRRSFVQSTSLFLTSATALGRVITAASPAHARGRRQLVPGYGPLLADPAGLVDLPKGFQYRVFSRTGELLTSGGVVPSSHDGMAAFETGRGRTWLVRNHEVEPEDVEEDGATPVPLISGATYDPEGTGGTSTLLVDRERRLLQHHISLAGTANNCAGGPTPWGTWLTCEEIDTFLSKPHGYVFEVDPKHGGNPEPIKAMGRFEHEAVAIDPWGRAYLSEDADSPFGCFYRYTPKKPLGGRGSLHAGGKLAAMALDGVDVDLSIVQEPGTILPVRWLEVPNVDPGEGEATVREQVLSLGATPIQKAEGVWTDADGSLWFVSSYGGGPDAEDEEDRSVKAHSGQIFKYDPKKRTLELVVLFETGSPFDGPDNITAGPHGFAVACTDGEDDQWLVGIDDEGRTFPLALNAMDDSEFAGATFSPDGETLFVNIQAEPALTLAIWGPWQHCKHH